MSRGWRLNPPPNWPTLPADAPAEPGWRPDPAWGPAPVGWTLWRRERRAGWVRRHRSTVALCAGVLLILAAAFGGPEATELISAGRDTPATPRIPRTPQLIDRAAVLVGPEVRLEPEREPAVRRPARPAQASRGHRPGGPGTPTAAPALPVPAERQELQTAPHQPGATRSPAESDCPPAAAEPAEEPATPAPGESPGVLPGEVPGGPTAPGGDAPQDEQQVLVAEGGPPAAAAAGAVQDRERRPRCTPSPTSAPSGTD